MPDGLLAIGGGISAERVLDGVRRGIFVWPMGGYEEVWFSPPRRMVLPVDELRVPRSLAKRARQIERQREEGTGAWTIRLDTAFRTVFEGCAAVHTAQSGGTWIVPRLVPAYVELHRRGLAHSAECWEGDELVGGLYGVAVGDVFSGESMFRTRSDASKLAFIHLVEQLRRWGFRWVDCQQYTDNLERFGARLIARRRYLALLEEAAHVPDRLGPWSFDDDFVPPWSVNAPGR